MLSGRKVVFVWQEIRACLLQRRYHLCCFKIEINFYNYRTQNVINQMALILSNLPEVNLIPSEQRKD